MRLPLLESHRHHQPIRKNGDTPIVIDDAELREQQTEGRRLDATSLETLVFGERS